MTTIHNGCYSNASRSAGNGARIRNLRGESCRNQVSLLILVYENAMSRAAVGTTSGGPSGAVWNSCLGGRRHHDGGTKAHPGLAKPDSVYNRRIIENPISLPTWATSLSIDLL
jgi:hypothetical protein